MSDAGSQLCIVFDLPTYPSKGCQVATISLSVESRETATFCPPQKYKAVRENLPWLSSDHITPACGCLSMRIGSAVNDVFAEYHSIDSLLTLKSPGRNSMFIREEACTSRDREGSWDR